MCSQTTLDNIGKATSEAVTYYWIRRKAQQEKQKSAGHDDQGARSAVTGGAQMNGFIELFTRIIIKAGMDSQYIFFQKALELPGYFRPTKEWDLLVVKEGQLVLAIEAKSQVGPSFGNNFNNRTEEAIGSALDLWTAFREGAFNNRNMAPFLGYFFLLEDCPASQTPVRIKEPHFKVFNEFVGSSYSKRYELFCRKLVTERHYSAAAFLTAQSESGMKGVYHEPASDLTMDRFVRIITAHISAYV
jgi:hypothetical protein